MRSFGWSVKKTLPSASAAGPSVNAKSPASFSTVRAGGAQVLESGRGNGQGEHDGDRGDDSSLM